MVRPGWIFCTICSLNFLAASNALGQDNRFTVSLLYSFTNTSAGAWPVHGLALDSAGNLYGVALAGLYQQGRYCFNEGCGGVYEMTSDGNGRWNTATAIHIFNGSDGGSPSTNLILSKNGDTIFGTASQGGVFGFGVVFQLSKAGSGWNYTVIHSFSNAEGSPSGLATDHAGSLYGMTYNGGPGSMGTVYKLSPSGTGSWEETILYSFRGSPDGAYPFSYPTYNPDDGSLYGTTQYGGANGDGTVFRLSPKPDGSWSEKILFDFAGENGASPKGPLLLVQQGQTILGTTSTGGAFAQGTVFLLHEWENDNWAENVIHSFNNDGSDGYSVSGGLLSTSTGHLYGTTASGGLNSGGIVYELLPTEGEPGSWTETVVHNFNPMDGADGSLPDGILVFNQSGTSLLSTTQEGGALTLGTVYQISATLGF